MSYNSPSINPENAFCTKLLSRIDKQMTDPIHVNKEGQYMPLVCLVCDCFILRHEIRYMRPEILESSIIDLLKPQRTINPLVKEYYTYTGEGTSKSIQSCLLSKKGIFTKGKFILCYRCHNNLEKDEMPTYAIANNFDIGELPPELACLSDVELAFISNIKCHTHLLSFFGGHSGIKGWHSLIKTNLVQKRRAMESINTISAVPNKVVVVIGGKMTPDQKTQILAKTTIRRDKCTAAMDFLLENHSHYMQYHDQLHLEDIPEPTIIDKSTPITSLNSNIELVEDIRVVFPDRTLQEETGGYETADEMKEFLESLTLGSVEAHLHIPDSQYVRDYEDNNFVLAFLKQYPYGTGGPNEKREVNTGKKKGIFRTLYPDEYVTHITNLSNPEFSTPLFTLVCFNLFFRHKMVQTAGWKVRAEETNSTSIAGLAPERVVQEIEKRNRGGPYYSDKNKQDVQDFLSMVHCVTSRLPHTTAAAKQGRKDVLSMQVHFGPPDVFFTVSPADDNSMILAVYSGISNPVMDINDMTKEVLEARCKQRSLKRFQYPALSTFNFEIILNIVIQEIIGWKASSKKGYFGVPKAYFHSVEEQSRKTLHVHILLWLHNSPIDLKMLESKPTSKTKKSMQRLIQYVDTVQNSAFFGNEVINPPHDCQQYSKKRKCIAINDDQTLRFLRHKQGSRELKGAIAKCAICSETWNASELALKCVLDQNLHMDQEELIIQSETKKLTRKDRIERASLEEACHWINKLKSDTSAPSPDTKDRLHKQIAQELIFGTKGLGHHAAFKYVNDSLYNVHSSLHVKTCWDKKTSECRYCFPKPPNKKTKIINTPEEFEWHDYRGRVQLKSLHTIVPQRGPFDVCINSSCPIISQSKIKGNSNVSVLLNGVHAFYTTKYASKDTQDQDASDYEPMKEYVVKRLIEAKFENPSSEALSRIIGAALSHTSKNIVSATMAKYLIDKGSRFGMSHPISYVPIYNLCQIIESKPIMLHMHNSIPDEEDGGIEIFTQGRGFEYIFRPRRLQKISAQEFYNDYTVRFKRRKEVDIECLPLEDGYTGSKYLEVTHKTQETIIGINNWQFVDTAKLSGDIMSKETPITSVEEEYARAVLVLLHPFRTKSDLTVNESYVCKFREVFHTSIKPHSQILQNIQDIRNAIRCRTRNDELEATTRPYITSEEEEKAHEEKNEDLDEVDVAFLNTLVHETSTMKNDRLGCQVLSSKPPTDINVDTIRGRGSFKCGYTKLRPADHDSKTCIFQYETSMAPNTHDMTIGPDVEIDNTSITRRMITLLLTKTTRNISDGNTDDIPIIENLDKMNAKLKRNNITTIDRFIQDNKFQRVTATGSAKSIIQWSKAIRYSSSTKSFTVFDDDQRKSFILILSHFILTFLEETIDNESTTRQSSTRSEKLRLQKLAAGKHRLRLFLDGPGGSGKSEVIKQIMVYAKEFCMSLEVPFTRYTILVTAWTGVAATLINGVTTSSGLELGKKYPSDAVKALFKTVRLIVVDEVSMICINTLKEIDDKLKDYGQVGAYYGGFNIIFAGDFRQLEPIDKTKGIYRNYKAGVWNEGINVYIELTGQYRFSDDPEWGAILTRFHQGRPCPGDFDRINQRVVGYNMKTKDGDVVPDGIRYCCPNNKDRDAINTGLFVESLSDNDGSLLVFASDLVIKKEKNDTKASYKQLKNTRVFYEECGESDCAFKNKSTSRIDPLMKLRVNTPVMFSNNLDVESGLANGTEALVQKIILKKDAEVFPITFAGKKTNAVLANAITSVQVCLEKKRDKIFLVAPQTYNFQVSLPRPFELSSKRNNRLWRPMKAMQVPFIHNYATTGHKLQGSSKDNLFINSFSYQLNWPYVALSRVRTIKGLFLRQPLKPEADYSIPILLQKMRLEFKNFKSLEHNYLDIMDNLVECI